MRVLHGPAAPTIVLRVSPDGRTAAAIHLLGNGGPRNTLAAWDLHAGSAEPYRIVEGDFAGFTFVGTGDWIAAAGSGHESLWLKTADLSRIGPIEPACSVVLGGAGTDRVWTAGDSARPNGAFRAYLPTESSAITAVHDGVGGRLKAQTHAIDLAPDGNRLAVVYVNQNNPRAGLVIGLFDLAKKKLGERFSTRRRQIQALRFAPDGRRLAVLTTTQVLVWDVETKKRLALLEATNGKAAGFTLAVEFGRNGRELFIGTDDGVHLYDTTTWTLRRRYDFGLGPVLSLAVTPDGLCGLAGGNGGSVAVWDLDD